MTICNRCFITHAIPCTARKQIFFVVMNAFEILGGGWVHWHPCFGLRMMSGLRTYQKDSFHSIMQTEALIYITLPCKRFVFLQNTDLPWKRFQCHLKLFAKQRC